MGNHNFLSEINHPQNGDSKEKGGEGEDKRYKTNCQGKLGNPLFLQEYDPWSKWALLLCHDTSKSQLLQLRHRNVRSMLRHLHLLLPNSQLHGKTQDYSRWPASRLWNRSQHAAGPGRTYQGYDHLDLRHSRTQHFLKLLLAASARSSYQGLLYALGE